ncbi:MAG TPA: DNA-binding protein [Syntrophorhabdaceae bacterium]|nr:DNA-binding protein [Syntrophorhabdaceae bacterium]HQM80010.1 DNA-binding protein [Syntrophorhabdaceae bacterium]
MKYQVGEVGRVVVAQLDDNDDILGCLVDIVKKERIKAGILYLVGGIKDARIVVGPVQDVMPPTPSWRELVDSHETLGIGTIFWYKDEPRLHLHGTYGKWDTVKTGCLREAAKTFLIMEAVIVEIKGVRAVRDLDPASDMVLLRLLGSFDRA